MSEEENDYDKVNNELENSFFDLFYDNDDGEIIEIEDERLRKKVKKYIYGDKLSEDRIKMAKIRRNLLKERVKRKIDDTEILQYLLRNGYEEILENLKEIHIENMEMFTKKEFEILSQKTQELYIENIIGITEEKLAIISDKVKLRIEEDSKENYTKDELLQLRKIFDKIKENMPHDLDEVGRMIYRDKTIALFASYDYTGCKDNENCTQERIDITRSLYGAFIEGNIVCSGYALASYMLATDMGDEEKIISGNALYENSLGGMHAWNQVKIGDRWYNKDLCWISRRIQEGKEVRYALRGDSFFKKEHKSSFAEECPEDYDQEKIEILYREIEYLPLKSGIIDETKPDREITQTEIS